FRNTLLPVIPVRADRDKLSRAHAVSAAVESGRVFLPERAPWLEDFLLELQLFPAGKHDDQVDSVTQALTYLNRRPAGITIYDMWTMRVLNAPREPDREYYDPPFGF